jgi:methylenetetrahydrofolate dehydrogenase (NADP+)/methenyltetrahydrofolate cyclohydrolase
VLHRNSPDLKNICKTADILIVAAGHPHLINASMVKKGAVIVDIGINKVDNVSLDKSLIVGDVDFGAVKKIASYISPVPGGVGPMTIAMLLENCVKSYKRHHKI